jgi:hypothetical protein
VALTSAGARERVCDGVREAAHTHKVATTTSVGVGRDRGVAAGNAAEPWSTPWVAASTAPAVGSRECVRVQPVARCVRGGQGNSASPLLHRDCVHEAPGHGEAAAVRPS